jgi:hypothetical protein
VPVIATQEVNPSDDSCTVPIQVDVVSAVMLAASIGSEKVTEMLGLAAIAVLPSLGDTLITVGGVTSPAPP